MKINWIVEKYMFEEYENQLIQTIKNSGHNCFLVDDTDLRFDFDRDIKTKYKIDDCVLFYGSLQRGRQILRDTAFIPGIFLKIENYECFKYYGYYGNNLVNYNYLLFGLNDLKRNKERIFNYFNTSSIFIRPSNGYKTFTGQLLSKENFEEELRILCLSYGGLDMDQLILVAPRQNIEEENRFIVLNQNGSNRIIDGNKYMIKRELVKERIFDIKACEFANSVVNNYTPDKAFTIDIAKMDNGSYKILEIGSFCCASWYNIDLEKVIKEVNELIINEYNEYYQV
jgi:hypothetical protein